MVGVYTRTGGNQYSVVNSVIADSCYVYNSTTYTDHKMVMELLPFTQESNFLKPTRSVGCTGLHFYVYTDRQVDSVTHDHPGAGIYRSGGHITDDSYSNTDYSMSYYTMYCTHSYYTSQDYKMVVGKCYYGAIMP